MLSKGLRRKASPLGKADLRRADSEASAINNKKCHFIVGRILRFTSLSSELYSNLPCLP